MLRTYVIVGLVSYLLGSIPFGLILMRLFRDKDVREVGSGNIGATNVARAGGPWLGIATLFLDALKGFLAVSFSSIFPLQDSLNDIGRLVSRNPYSSFSSYSNEVLVHSVSAVAVTAGLMAIVGHSFPVWLRFKGGKGVATALGAFAALTPMATSVVVVVFLLVVGTTRFVSLGSVLSAAVFPVACYVVDPEFRALPILTLTLVASLIIIGKHQENIRRILAGTEHRLGAKTPEASA